MQTKDEREAEFLRDFVELLRKHEAEFQVGDDGRSYGMHTGIATISMDGKWDDKFNEIAEYTEFRLPGYIPNN